MTDTPDKQAATDDHAILQAVLESAVDGVIAIDGRGRMETVNAAAEKLFGYSADEMIGQNVTMLMPSPYREEHDGYLANYAKTRRPQIIGIGREVTGRRKDGSVFPLYLAVSEVKLNDRQIFTGFVHDLTDLKQAEDHATQLGRILESSQNEIYVFDAESFQFLLVNQGALENLGYTSSEMSRMTPVDLKPEFDSDRLHAELAPLLTGNKSVVQFETIHQRKDSSTYYVTARLQRTVWEGSEAFVAIILDVSERRQVQESLRLANHELTVRDAQLSFMVENLPAAAAYLDIRTGEIKFNRVVEKITGYAPSELSTKDECFDRFFGTHSGLIRSRYERNMESWLDRPRRLQVTRKDGIVRMVEFRGYRYDDHEVWLLDDITDRDRRETEFRIRDQAIQSANESIVIVDATRPDYPVVFVNKAFESLSGTTADQVLGQSCDLLCGDTNDETFDGLRSAILNHREHRETVLCVRADGSKFWNEISLAPVRATTGKVTHIVAVMEDVTEQRQAQNQLLQSERLAAIGQVVTGLAHESRNALQRSQACLDMLALDLEDQPQQLELTNKIRRAMDDLHRNYEEVRNYAAPINLEWRTVNIRKLIRQTWRHLESSRANRECELIELEDESDATCEIDVHRMEQVFRNIMENALAVCSDAGRLTVSCMTTLEADAAHLRVAFHDNGPGFSPDSAENVFVPFFTTKQKGTGLGMAISKRIVDAHGGRIEVRNHPDGGGEVIVLLPQKTSP